MCAASRLLRHGVIAAFIALSLCPAEASETHAYYARRVWTGQGSAIDDAVLIVVNGKVSAVGPRATTQVPEGATRHELDDQVIIPGLVVAQTSLAGNDDVERTLSPQNTALDGFDFYADRHEALAGGVTTVQISPGSSRLMPGVGAVVKLGTDDPGRGTLRRREGLRIVLESDALSPPTIYEPPVGAVSVDRPLEQTRPQLSPSLGGAVAGLRAVLGAARRNTAGAPTDEADLVMAAISSHLSNGGSVRITASTAAEIRLALDLAKEFDLRAVLVDPSDLTPFTSRFGEWKSRLQGVVLEGRRPGRITNPSPEQIEERGEPWDEVKALVDAGIRVAIHAASDQDLEDFLFVAGQFRQGDLTVGQTLSAITSASAEILGVADRVGSLKKGLDADFVVLSADPFSLQSHVLSTYVDGRRVFHRETTDPTTIVQADAIYTGDGEVLGDASVVVRGHTIRGVGERVSAPRGARVKRFPGAVIVPGFVDLGSGLGIGGTLGDDIALETRLGEQLDATDPAIEVARQGGVTTVLLGSSGGATTPLVAFKLGDDTRVVSDPAAIRFRLSDNLRQDVPNLERTLERGKAYHEQWLAYETALAEWEARQKEAKTEPEASTEEQSSEAETEADSEAGGEEQPAPEEGRGRGRRPRGGDTENGEGPPQRRGRFGGRGQEPAPEEGEQDEDGEEAGSEQEPQEEEAKDEAPRKPQTNAGLEPYRLLFSGKIPAFVEANRSDAIEAALELFRGKHQLRTVLIGVEDLARFPDLLNGHEVTVIAGPSMMVTKDRERLNVPQHLANEGIPFGFQSRATTGVRDLPSAVQYAVSQGLGPADALRGLSAGGARLVSDSPSFGSIAVGRDADLVVLSGPPFELGTKVLAVMVDGQWVYEKESDR
ncbi:MAG: amidohydrolase family protein [Planctomycetota bacterium]